MLEHAQHWCFEMNASFDKISAALSAETDTKFNSTLESLREMMELQHSSTLSMISQSVKEALASSGFGNLRNVVQAAQSAVSSYVTVTSELSAACKKAISSLSEQLKIIPKGTITEERKLELISSFQQWGEYGWTIIPTASFSLYSEIPANRTEANKMALQACSKSTIERLFRSTAKMKYCKNSDFSEAVFDFENKKYKSCALVLFALIDAKLIRLQRTSDLKGKRRDVGVRAVDKARCRADERTEEYMFFTILSQTNLFACLETLFGSGNDFKRQPEIINRNFIDHGMLTRKVTRLDCLQLFLLYYNLLHFLEFLYK